MDAVHSSDRFGRKISYLRISVTDRCNLRCVYCMPAEGVPWQPHHKMMKYEEITRVVEASVELGINKIRITGGEPLVRKNLSQLIRMIANIPGITDLAITTNGILLEDQARELADAGLMRVNVSLDTLDEKKFEKITRGGSLQKVLRGIEAAENYNLIPVKINVVALRGLNDDEILSLARLTLEKSWHVRFIELMPVNNQMSWGAGFPLPEHAFLATSEMIEMLEPLQLEPIFASKDNGGPAQEYRAKGACGTIGFISPLSNHFCKSCNRLRLTADGNLRPCLLSDMEIPLIPAIRDGKPVKPLIEEALAKKPLGHELSQAHYPTSRAMRQIGG